MQCDMSLFQDGIPAYKLRWRRTSSRRKWIIEGIQSIDSLLVYISKVVYIGNFCI